jgi:adenosylmethionine---8-amino-7-oxononanoate aminotransferase
MTKLQERDKKIIWHPYTQEKTENLPIAIKKGAGSYLYDEDGRAYLDLISSWWVNIHGHAHPEIAKTIYEQACSLDHVLFAGCTHEPAVQLCENLAELLPLNLSRFFFSDNGSTCVEIALKMAYQYWRNQGQNERSLFLTFDGGYHGDTVGAMSVGANSGFHDVFRPLFFKILSIPYPETYIGDNEVEQKERKSLEILEKYLNEFGKKIAALIVEPLIQGARGMRMCRAEFLRAFVEKVRAHGILVVFDEVMTGFGRTGSNFAFEQAGVIPDFLCLSKGLTGGFLPLALTVTTETIYKGFSSDRWETAFAHGHSYTANPIACAAANASVSILKRTSTQCAIGVIHNAQKAGVASLCKLGANIAHPRVLGTIAAFDVQEASFSSKSFRYRLLQEGLLLRPLGRTVYVLPPYSTTAEELHTAYEKIGSILGA